MRTPSIALRTLTLLVLLATASAVGCGSIMDEIDSAHELVGIGDEKKDGKVANEAEPVKKGIDWSVSRSINTGQVDESIVSCKLGGATQFMRKNDCLTQGGKPGRV